MKVIVEEPLVRAKQGDPPMGAFVFLLASAQTQEGADERVADNPCIEWVTYWQGHSFLCASTQTG